MTEVHGRSIDGTMLRRLATTKSFSQIGHIEDASERILATPTRVHGWAGPDAVLMQWTGGAFCVELVAVSSKS